MYLAHDTKKRQRCHLVVDSVVIARHHPPHSGSRRAFEVGTQVLQADASRGIGRCAGMHGSPCFRRPWNGESRVDDAWNARPDFVSGRCNGRQGRMRDAERRGAEPEDNQPPNAEDDVGRRRVGPRRITQLETP